MKKNHYTLPLITFIITSVFFLLPAKIYSQNVYALSGNNLIVFSANNPALILRTVPVTGIVAGQELSNIDFRPSTGQLYGLGYNSSNSQAQLYTLNRTTGAATVINTLPVMLSLGTGKVSFDFNPTVDRIRVTGSNNSNYRLHPETGAIAATDGNLAFATGDVNNGIDPSVGTVAYSNSYIGATSTTLYNYDDSLNIFTTQAPPNAGTLNTIGSSGISVNLNDASSDLDIYFDPLLLTNTGYFSANTNGSLNDNLYTVNLSTGNTTLVGAIGGGVAVKDIAVRIIRAIPFMVKGNLLYALNSSNMLITLDSEMPEIIRHAEAVTGITTGQIIAGMDFRPATMQLYILGYDTLNGNAQLYMLDRNSGVATAVAAPVVLALGKGKIGFDFNPTVDRIRVTGSNNANYRLHPQTGAIVATDGSLAFATGDVNQGIDPSIGTVAYTNSYIGATSTILYNYDDSLNVLTTQLPPNAGTLNTIGSSGITVNTADQSTDLDIFYDAATSSNVAYLAANTTGASDNLYSVNLSTGVLTSNGKIGYGIAVKDIAAYIKRTQPAPVSGDLIYALTSSNVLITFDSDFPTLIRSSKTISGVTAGQLISGMDFRPATGELYILGYDTANGNAQVYKLQPANGTAMVVNSIPVSLSLGKGKIGFDFNPVADRIRITGSNNSNYRLHPESGAIASVDTMLAFVAGDVNAGINPSIGTSAYINSISGTAATSLYNYDDSLNVFTTQNPPNNGALNTVGISGLTVNLADQSSDLDIGFNSATNINTAYFIANTVSTFDNLYTVDLSTGAATLVGKIGNGIAVKDIAVLISIPNQMRSASTVSETVNKAIVSTSIFPNPAVDQAYLLVDLLHDRKLEVIVTDVAGRTAYISSLYELGAGSNKITLDINALLPGIYFVSLKSEEGITDTVKMVVE
ncbi:MAG: DUF4394 domain-containing protein [Bacteroidota bacterium]